MGGFLRAVAGSFSAAVSYTWTAIQIFNHGMFKLRDSANDHSILIQSAGDNAADRTLSVPALGADDTIDVLAVAQTFTALKTFDAGLTVTSGQALTASDYNGVAGVAVTVDSVAPAQTASAQAGTNITITASDAIAGSSNAGAAAGASLTVSTGDAKRLTSGNANGGNFVVSCGAGIGTGTVGYLAVRQEAGTPGTDEIQIKHDGSRGYIDCKDGALRFLTLDSAEAGQSNNFQFWSSDGGYCPVWFQVYGGNGGLAFGVGATPRGDSLITKTGSILPSNGGFYWYNATNTYSGPVYLACIKSATDAGILKITGGGSGGNGDSGQINLKRGTAPSTPDADCAGLSSQDVASSAEMFAIGENANLHQLTGLCKQLASDATNATATMANLTDLTINVLAGKKYTGKMIVYCANSLAADGAKFDFDGGTATMTTFRAHGTLFDTALLLSAQTSALATDFAQATVTGDAMFEVHFSFVCNAAGTLIPRFAGNSAVSGTLTAYKCSSIELRNAA